MGVVFEGSHALRSDTRAAGRLETSDEDFYVQKKFRKEPLAVQIE